MKNTKRIRESRGDQLMYTVTNIVLICLTVLILYPLIYVLSASFSSPSAVTTGEVVLWPVDFSLKGYSAVLSYSSVWTGYANTLFYTIVGTIINVTVTMFCAYPLSRRDMQFRRFYTIFFLITMYFGGGLIPTYVLVSKLHLTNTRAIMLISGAMSVYNMIVARTFIAQNIPTELLEASQIDGCNDFAYFFRIIIPLAKPILAVLALFYAVAHWNEYFNAMIYLSDRNKYPLQLFLRQILIMNQFNPSDMANPELMEAKKGMYDLLKYSLIVVSTAPILVAYPFAQKYFTKGIMIGSVKG